MALHRTAVTFGLLISLGTPILGVSEPVPLANWAELQPNGKFYGKLLTTQEDQCLPDIASTTFPIPTFAKIAFVSWRVERPKCTRRDETVSAPVESVVLVAHESMDEVLEWYRPRMRESHYVEYTIRKGLDEECTGKEPVESTFVVFSEANSPQFCWNNDLRKSNALIIKQSDNVFRSHGYNTTIEIRQFAI